MSSNDKVFEQLLEDLGPRSEAIGEALKDVRQVCASPAFGWVDRRAEPKLTVYVLSGGVLHRLRGGREPVPDP
jgi:hypothetical protein